MKKIIKYILLIMFVVTPFVSHAATCTGELRTNLADAEACAALAEQQGSALGYTIDCKVEQLGLGGYTDPTSGKDYILNTVCSVNGSAYEYGAYNLAGFTAGSDSNALIKDVNSGWDILSTDIAYSNAYKQCGGAPYYINGAYTCTAPAGASPATSPGSSLKTSSGFLSTEAAVQQVLRSIFSVNKTLTQNILTRYEGYAKAMLSAGTSTSSPASVNNSQCYQFTKTLQVGSSGLDVFALTYALKQEGFLTETTSLFDANVMTAVKKFQEAHATEILTIQGLTMGTGVVGEKTRAYLNSKCIKVPSSTGDTITKPPVSNTCTTTASVSNQKTGVYKYTFTKNTDSTYKIQLNNPAYGSVGDKYYVAPNFSFNAPNALDLNRQNQGWFNYLSSLPGTAEGNTFYQNMFGSFNNAYYDWDNMVTQLNAKIASCSSVATGGTTSGSTGTGVINNGSQTTTSIGGIRFVQVSVNDWETLPIVLREIRVYGENNTLIKVASISTEFVNNVPIPLIDGNDNTVWQSNKVSGQDLQVITLDLGKEYAVTKVAVTNYGQTTTRVFVIEVSKDGNMYTQIAEVRAQENAPIADRGIVYGYVTAASTVGPIQAPSVGGVTNTGSASVSTTNVSSVGTVSSQYAPFIGAYIWGSQSVSAGGNNVVSNAVNFAADKGFKIVRLTLSPRSLYDYGISSGCDSKTLTQIAASDVFKQALSHPSISTYILTVYDMTTFGDCTNKKYMNPEFTRSNSASISQEYKDLTAYLYQTYKNTGKKFILLNWEGDNDLYCGQAYNYAVDTNFKAYCDSNYQSLYSGNTSVNDSILGMQQWLEARTLGVNAGKIQAIASGVVGVSVDSGAEFNIVNVLKNNGYKSVLYDVLPTVPYDYASYSAYESINQTNPSTALAQDIIKIKSQTSKPIIIGEFGFDKDSKTSTEIETYLKDVSNTIKNTGLPYGIVWQLFDQQGSNFGLFDNLGTPELFNALVTQ